MSEPLLAPHERDNPLWQKIKKHLEQRLTELRAKNDNPKRDAESTAFLRGRIDEVKLLLGLDAPPPVAEKDDSRFKD